MRTVHKMHLNKIILFLILFFTSNYAVSQPWGESGMGGDFGFFAQRVNSQGMPSAPQIISEEELIQERGYPVDKVVARATPSATKRPRAVAAAAAVEEAEADASAAAAAAPAPSRSRRGGGGGGGGAAAAAMEEAEEGASAAAAAAAPAPAPSRSRRGGGGGAAAAAAVEAEEDTGAATAAPAPSRSSRRGGGGGGAAVEAEDDDSRSGRKRVLHDELSSVFEIIYELCPFKSIGPVKLGVSRTDIRALFAEDPLDSYGCDIFNEACISVEYDPDTDKSCYIDGLIPACVTYDGCLLVNTPANKLFKWLKGLDPDVEEREDGNAFTSKKLGVNIVSPGFKHGGSRKPPIKAGTFTKDYFSEESIKKREKAIEKMVANFPNYDD